MDVKAFGVNAREHVKRSAGFNARDTRDLVNQLPGFITLLKQASAWLDKFADALITTERCLNGMLHRNVGTQTHRSQHFQPFDITFRMFFRAVQNHPSLAEACYAVSF